MNKEKQILQELEQLRKNLSKNQDHTQRSKIQQEIEQKEGQLNRLKREQKKLQKNQELKRKNNLFESFSSGKIQWRKNKKTNLYPTWDGYYRNELLFKLEQKFMGYHLTLLTKNKIHNSFDGIQKEAEKILEHFVTTTEKVPIKTQGNKPKIEQKELILPKYLQEKLADIPEDGMGYHDVHLLLYDDTIIYNVPIMNGSVVKLPTGKNIKIEDIKDII